MAKFPLSDTVALSIPGIAVVEVELLLFKDKLNGYHPNYAQYELCSVDSKRQDHS